MRRIVLIAILAAFVGAESWAIPLEHFQLERIPDRPSAPRQDQCFLSYYNVCSGWMYYWVSYCQGVFHWAPAPPRYGTVFDLSDCPSGCRQLGEVWWAWHYYHLRSSVDIEIYCADELGCPLGSPIAGVYQYQHSGTWQHVDFGGLPLCVCEDEGADSFVVMVTLHCGPSCTVLPLSDAHPLNMQEGCETEWRCAGHSYCYRNVVSYCDVYGEPAPLWVSGVGFGCTEYPPVPPGCHNYFYNTGCSAEWLIDCYVSCEGATEAEKGSWSEIKALYR
jgi:hypothetical protein